MAGFFGALAIGGVEDIEGVLEGCVGGELVGGGVALEGGVLLFREVGEAGGEAVSGFGLRDGFTAVELGDASVLPGVGAEQEAAAGANGEAGLGGEFAAVAAVFLPGIVALLFEVAELELAFVFAGAEFEPGLAGGVVEDELVVAALPVPAVGELLGFKAGETGAVGMGVGLVAGEEGGGVGAGLEGAGTDLIALGVSVALAVVGGAGDDGAVDVAVLEGDDDFLPGARGVVAAPVVAGDGGNETQPDAEAVVGGSVVRAGGVGVAAGGLAAALPGEFDADAAVAVGMGGSAIADDDAGEGAAGGGPGVDVPAVGVGHQRSPGDAGAQGGEVVAVEVRLRAVFAVHRA